MFNTLVKAKAKLIKNNKLKTLRLIVAFNVYETNAKGELKFPVQSKCAYVSGDLRTEDVFNALECAKRAVRAEIELV
jgi:hypothetical protein